jgi:hypothetical protein
MQPAAKTSATAIPIQWRMIMISLAFPSVTARLPFGVPPSPSNDGKAIGISLFIGKRPRDYAYGPAGGLPDTKVGIFPQSLMDEAKTRGWTSDQHEELSLSKNSFGNRTSSGLPPFGS